MKEILLIGVDISKSTLDLFQKPANVGMRVSNNEQGFTQWYTGLKQIWDGQSRVMVIMEHTGQYSYRFESFLQAHGIPYCRIAALQIKRSMGMVRGKNDKIDAERIAAYGWLRRDSLTAEEHQEKAIEKLRMLLSLRTKLVRDRSGYICRLKEMKATGTCTSHDDLGRVQQQIIEMLTSKILLLEDKIKSLMTSSLQIQKTAELLRSIKGVGWIVAAYMISCTQNFRRFKCARKFNCYAGLAPFQHQSGSSIKGKTRVSHLANKEAKTLLNLAALSAVRFDQEMKTYYQRRVAEGKRKMSCLNIIRAKLIARIFAVVKRQTPYLDNYSPACLISN